MTGRRLTPAELCVQAVLTAPLAAVEHVMGTKLARHAQEQALASLKGDWSGIAIGELVGSLCETREGAEMTFISIVASPTLTTRLRPSARHQTL